MHGPFERISLCASNGARESQLSVYRVGDLLVDAGGTRVAAALAAVLREDPPRRIVVTHQHEDHAGGIAALRRELGHVPAYAPALHVDWLRVPRELPAYRERAWGPPEPVPDALGYGEGTVFEAGGVAIEAVPAPGHTPGHMALIGRKDGVTYALTGDLYVAPRPFAGWYESAADALVRSWRALAARPFRLLPSHRDARDDGQRLFTEVADHVERAADRVLDAAARLGTRDPVAVGAEALGPEGTFAAVSGGEFSHAAFARSVLDPVRALPAAPLRIR